MRDGLSRPLRPLTNSICCYGDTSKKEKSEYLAVSRGFTYLDCRIEVLRMSSILIQSYVMHLYLWLHLPATIPLETANITRCQNYIEHYFQRHLRVDRNRPSHSQANNVDQIRARCGQLQPANTAGRKRGKYVPRYPSTCSSNEGTLASAQENAPCVDNAAWRR
jgi:hypothetical protein